MRKTDDFPTPVTVESLASAVTALADEIYRSLGIIGAGLTTLWEGFAENPRHTPRSTDLAPLRETIVGELEQRGNLFESAGVVLADGVLADRPRHLEWWFLNTQRGPQRLLLELDPRSEYFYDYTQMEWFAIPRDQGRRWAHGPCLDYACTDQYICTFAVPVTIASGTFLGIAGADVPVASIEEVLLPRFRAAGQRVVLVNGEGRVIMGTDSEFTTGSKTSRMHRPAAAVPVEATPWSLQPLGSH
ncbi:cache domain-containing protein [Nocardia abscessus]|uniref:cache domain-containing protein n=1 Tax=Nocardia abscessus TaxID=120957 RepID=UPI0002F08417|nr:cache domain-containing protein [Nocardia abscessus]MCC3330903.1 cache domain-containing protein [Nocardia abscessus]